MFLWRERNADKTDDLQAHCGEGKRVLRRIEVRFDGNLSRLPGIYALDELFCSAYLPSQGPRGRWQPDGPVLSWRMLQIGPYRFWIEYQSRNDWRSNCGDCACTLIGAEKDAGLYPGLEAYKLFAVDFVLGQHLYAIDFNIAPGVRGTGVEAFLTS